MSTFTEVLLIGGHVDGQIATVRNLSGAVIVADPERPGSRPVAYGVQQVAIFGRIAHVALAPGIPEAGRNDALFPHLAELGKIARKPEASR